MPTRSRRARSGGIVNGRRAVAREGDGVLLPLVRLRLRLPAVGGQSLALAARSGVEAPVGYGTPSSPCSSSRARSRCGSAASRDRRPRARAGGRARARRRGACRAGRRVADDRLRPCRRRLCERVRRVDGLLLPPSSLLALVWVEIQLATALRNRDGEAVRARRARRSIWSFIAGIGVLTWVVLYLA